MKPDEDDKRLRLGVAKKFLVRLLHIYFALTRGMTLGVRAACFDAEGRVFLVRHTYVPGWHLPGGGVERGETTLDSLAKELREEGNLAMTSVPLLFHAYFNHQISGRDHVLLYRVSVTQIAPRIADREIAEAGFFPLDALPEETTAATRARLAEIAGLATPSGYWS
ncbi:NUDIX domain-containing protein [Peteryoungia ipomoeae]|uniref:NUDIX domain-containing protein n=1 Tax=Peteryoungia ipomoeae TaxID=1210932 RepID=A0A4S8P609_9HYPH|nr:NUDIX domain-containing protein [Peteryoungia ipomoeae]THV24655.1 NUDIX domain-containing protein [Peteryoungia ipomoeae]